MQSVVHASMPRRQLQRKLLRAANGAAIGAIVGGMLGYGLGAVSAFVVDAIATTFFASTPTWSQQWTFCAGMGLVPAVPAGLLLGTSIIMRSDHQRLLVGSGLGLLVGMGYAKLWFGSSIEQSLVVSAIIGSGLVGGLVLTLILTAIRRYWKWWIRWEVEQSAA